MRHQGISVGGTVGLINLVLILLKDTPPYVRGTGRRFAFLETLFPILPAIQHQPVSIRQGRAEDDEVGDQTFMPRWRHPRHSSCWGSCHVRIWVGGNFLARLWDYVIKSHGEFCILSKTPTPAKTKRDVHLSRPGISQPRIGMKTIVHRVRERSSTNS